VIIPKAATATATAPAAAAVEVPAEGGMEGGGSSWMKRNNGKPKREEDFKRIRWLLPTEEVKAEDLESLKTSWAPWLSSGDGGALGKLFPASGRKGVALDPSIYLGGVDVLASVLSESLPTYIDNLDLVLRWCALRLCDKENVQVLHRLLEHLLSAFAALKAAAYSLKDVEASILLPHLLEKSGQGKERFRVLFRQAMRLVCDLYPFSKYGPYLIVALGSKNIRTRTACLEDTRRILAYGPPSALGKRGLREVGKYLEAREPEIRNLALEVMLEVYD
ncbi:hypothetical protein VYU27_010422, partial [Nannochloropsis oceanica]